MSIEAILIFFFILGYAMIALEHTLKIDKTAPALLSGMTMWAVFAVAAIYFGYVPEAAAEAIAHGGDHGGHGGGHAAGGSHATMAYIEAQLTHHLFEISNILFFLLGAMTIVETIDIHDGFAVITSKIKTTNKVKLLWILTILTFFLSAILDNLTTSIVMASLVTKMISEKKLRLLYAGAIVIAANAGGAWSPIGDVTTTMLWIKGQISVIPIVVWLIIPSLVCMIIPTFVLSKSSDMKGTFERLPLTTKFKTTPFERIFVLSLGVGCLLFVPVFKTVTHLQPFMGMLFGVGLLWQVTDFMHKKKSHEEKTDLSVTKALAKIDAPSVLFFLGILSAVACLQSVGVLGGVAVWLRDTIGNFDAIVLVIGVLSAIVDNVPLVAASQGMYEVTTPEMLAAAANPAETAYLTTFLPDGKFWQFLAYCAGTGGSILIIGSAAGVAVMGIEKIDFIWYMKRFGWLAFIGYIAGAIVYLVQFQIFA